MASLCRVASLYSNPAQTIGGWVMGRTTWTGLPNKSRLVGGESPEKTKYIYVNRQKQSVECITPVR